MSDNGIDFSAVRREFAACLGLATDPRWTKLESVLPVKDNLCAAWQRYGEWLTQRHGAEADAVWAALVNPRGIPYGSVKPESITAARDYFAAMEECLGAIGNYAQKHFYPYDIDKDTRRQQYIKDLKMLMEMGSNDPAQSRIDQEVTVFAFLNRPNLVVLFGETRTKAIREKIGLG